MLNSWHAVSAKMARCFGSDGTLFGLKRLGVSEKRGKGLVKRLNVCIFADNYGKKEETVAAD